MPVTLGWWLSSEEHEPRALVEHAVRAESVGFTTSMISDHLQPWVRKQGQSPHVWSMLGAVLQATEALEVGTGVTALVHRTHPVEVAQAAATLALLSGDRVFVGLGTGERLNEQAFGARWPRAGERRDRLEEAVEVIRRLWAGDVVNHRGAAWQVEHLRLWTRPARSPQLLLAAGGKRSAALAGRVADGMIGVAPDHQTVDVFRGSGGEGKRCIAQLHVSIAPTVDEALDAAWTWWPNGVVPAPLLTEVARPQHFEVTAEAIGRATIGDAVVCATDATPIVRAVDRFVAAGFDTVHLHQVGPDQARLADLARAELLPHYAHVRSADS